MLSRRFKCSGFGVILVLLPRFDLVLKGDDFLQVLRVGLNLKEQFLGFPDLSGSEPSLKSDNSCFECKNLGFGGFFEGQFLLI